jgi:hypothetical protein
MLTCPWADWTGLMWSGLLGVLVRRWISWVNSLQNMAHFNVFWLPCNIF